MFLNLPSGIKCMTAVFMPYKMSIKLTAKNGFRKKAINQLINTF